MSMEKKKLTWGLTYFEQFILSMFPLLTTCHNIRAANGVKSPNLESHEVLEKMEEFKSNLCIKQPDSICIWLELCVCMLELYGLAIKHCISLL